MEDDQDFSWQELGHRVRDWRMRAGMSQKQLAEAAGLTPAGLFRIEAGNTNPQLETLRRIAAALGCSVRELFCGHLVKDDALAGPRAGAYRVVDRVLESGDEAALKVLSSAMLTCQELLDRRSRVPGQEDQYLFGWRLPKHGEKIQQVRSTKKYRVQRATGEWITIGGPDKSETNVSRRPPNNAETRDHDDK
jgi:transcriptional regulator with XRE-family HTH domain